MSLTNCFMKEIGSVEDGPRPDGKAAKTQGKSQAAATAPRMRARWTGFFKEISCSCL